MSIWREEKCKVRRVSAKAGKLRFRTETGLTSDDAPGLFVLEGEYYNLSDGFNAQGGKVHVINTGTSISRAFVGTEPACELAIALARIHDWTTCEAGVPISLSPDALVLYRQLITDANAADDVRIAAIKQNADAEQERGNAAFGARLEALGIVSGERT